jgi:hypothetical protein
MRTIPIALLVLLFTACAAYAERYDAKTWRRVQTYDMQTLQKMEPLPMRQIVGVRFNYRAKRIEHLKPNWHYSSIWSRERTGRRDHFTNIPVMVSSAALPAFQAISTEPHGGGSYVVYGQVLEDADAKFLFLRLMGTKLKTDKAGNVTVGW